MKAKASRRTTTACTMDCPDACSLQVRALPDGSIRLHGNPQHPVTAGFVCRKIKRHIRRLRSPERILRPQRRKGAGWQTISWEDALDLCAEKIDRLRAEPASILHVFSSGAKGVLKEATTLFFSKLGASRTRGSLCDAAGIMASVHDFGSRENNDISDLSRAGAIVNWGKDAARSSVHTAAVLRRARRGGARLLTISPGDPSLITAADQHIRIRPGTDRFLAAALIKLLKRRGAVNADMARCTRKPAQFFRLLEAWSVKELLAACDVDPVEMEALYEVYAGAVPAATLIGAGVQRYRYGGENLRFIDALALLSGNVGVSGGGVYFHLQSFHNLNLDWIKSARKKAGRSFPLPLIGRGILTARKPPVRMLWVNGINLVNQVADIRTTLRAFEKVDFKVVADAFMNDTARRADLLLPCTLMLEQEDIIGSFLHEYVHHVTPVLPAPGEAREDYRILRDIGRRLKRPIFLPDEETCFQMALASPYLSVTLADLKRDAFTRSNRPQIAYAGRRFDHADGRYRFPVELHPEAEPPAGYPLRLLSLVRQNALHSQMLPEDQTRPPVVWVAPDCTALEGLQREKPVYLVSPLGRMTVRLSLMEGLHPEAVVYRRGDWFHLGGGINQLISACLSDIGSGAPFYHQYVRLENG
jgi:anaerobic selenocysteine-containing dehydrogenase